MSDIQAPSGATYTPILRPRELDSAHRNLFSAWFHPDSWLRKDAEAKGVWRQVVENITAQLVNAPSSAIRRALAVLPLQARRELLRRRWRAEGGQPVGSAYDRDVTEIVAQMSGKRLPPQVGVHKCKECRAHGGVNNPYRPYPNPAHVAWSWGAGAYEMLCGGVWLD